MTRIISIANQKGGVGKTTTAINLSASLAHRGMNVYLLDLDPQGNSTSGVGVDKNNLEFSAFDLLVEQKTLAECLIPTEFKNLSLLPSNSDLVSAEAHLMNHEQGSRRLSDAIHEYISKQIESAPDFIIIDGPPSLGLLTLNALIASHSLLIPVQCEYYALEGLAELFNTFTVIKEQHNPNMEMEGILLTMFDKRTTLSNQVQNEIREHYPNQVFQTVIPRSVRLSEAPSHGKPILLYDPFGKGSDAYLELSKEVIENEQKRAR